ncbi:MAG: PspC domain-containing protein [Candidatus Marinimicrobia bacterium]|nr:PspC domain-containing protein [Candidatus Neomarinimicrobiota bacterium]
MYRSRDQRKIAGVCGGLAEFFKVDPTLVRVIWVAGALLYGATVLLYPILMIALPEKKPAGDLEPSGD